MCLDISDFYLETPLLRPEYVKLKLSDLPEKIKTEYKVSEKATADNSVYVKVQKAMYGLPQAGLLSNQLFEKRLGKFEYYHSTLVPGLWKHKKKNY